MGWWVSVVRPLLGGGLCFQCSFVGGRGAFRLQEEGGTIRGRVIQMGAERALMQVET